MEAYHVIRGVFNFSASTVNAPLKVHDVREAESISVLLSMLQHFEQDFPHFDHCRFFPGLLWGNLDRPP